MCFNVVHILNVCIVIIIIIIRDLDGFGTCRLRDGDDSDDE